MSKRSLALLVEDLWESIEKIERYTEGMTQDSFQNDEKTTDAVVRNLEIIGEAAGRLPKEFLAALSLFLMGTRFFLKRYNQEPILWIPD